MANAKEEYRQKLLDPRWQKMRLQVYERDGFKCRSCHSEDRTLHAHHTYYRYGADPWDYPASSIITLCESCHDEEHECMQDVTNMIVRAFCDTGFGSHHDLYDVARGFSYMPGDLTPGEFVKLFDVIGKALRSRCEVTDGGDGKTWNALLALSEHRQGGGGS